MGSLPAVCKGGIKMYSIWWGLSMYGGYYAQIVDIDNKIHAFHAEKLRELKAQIAELDKSIKLDRAHRYDN